MCRQGYYFDNNMCNLLCGDGIYMNVQGVDGCDDGNLRNGDGCSSLCIR